MKQKITNTIICISIMLMAILTVGCGEKSLEKYGVFIGINGDEAKVMQDYETVVIEPSEFTKDDIAALHEAGKLVYGYINVGAIEQYRPYYNDFQDIALGEYENWEDESWVDTSSEKWQEFIVGVLGRQYEALGIDGFFVDNADVYYNYPDEKIYAGLCEIIKGLKDYGGKIIINGGDYFVSRTIEEGIARELFDGINQETVFTSIDFESQEFARQEREETEYFKAYIEKAKDSGIDVYLLEYGADDKLKKEIDSYCKEKGFGWYNAKSLNLDGK